jgi:dihydrolipoamide dehydrogenase
VTYDYDITVIGGGPGGYVAAIAAAREGKKVCLVEKGGLGGVCLNEGCIPSKTLLHSAKIYDYAQHGEVYGVTTKGAALDHAAVIARKNKVVQTLVSGVKALMKASKVKVIEGTAHIADANHVEVNDEVHEGKRLIIANGSEPVIPPIDGVAEGIKCGFVLTNREILDLQ